MIREQTGHTGVRSSPGGMITVSILAPHSRRACRHQQSGGRLGRRAIQRPLTRHRRPPLLPPCSPRGHAPSSFVSRHCAAARRRRRPPAWRPREVDAGRARTGPRRSSREASGVGGPQSCCAPIVPSIWIARWLSARSSLMTDTVAPARPWTHPAAHVEQTMRSTRRTSRPSARPAAAQVSTRAMFGNAAAVIECSSVWLVSTAGATPPIRVPDGSCARRGARRGAEGTSTGQVTFGAAMDRLSTLGKPPSRREGTRIRDVHLRRTGLPRQSHWSSRRSTHESSGRGVRATDHMLSPACVSILRRRPGSGPPIEYTVPGTRPTETNRRL
jgi:hypothetical protein